MAYFGYASPPNTNVVMVIGGSPTSTGAWVSWDGIGGVWNQMCSTAATCAYPGTSLAWIFGSVVGLYDQQTFVTIAGQSGIYSNQVAYSSNMDTSWQTYAAPFVPRSYTAATVDLDNYVYLYGHANETCRKHCTFNILALPNSFLISLSLSLARPSLAFDCLDTGGVGSAILSGKTEQHRTLQTFLSISIPISVTLLGICKPALTAMVLPN